MPKETKVKLYELSKKANFNYVLGCQYGGKIKSSALPITHKKVSEDFTYKT